MRKFGVRTEMEKIAYSSLLLKTHPPVHGSNTLRTRIMLLGWTIQVRQAGQTTRCAVCCLKAREHRYRKPLKPRRSKIWARLSSTTSAQAAYAWYARAHRNLAQYRPAFKTWAQNHPGRVTGPAATMTH